MNFNDINKIKEAGFSGFETIEKLRIDKKSIPKEGGVYFIINLAETSNFIEKGSGGFYKGKNPNVSIDTLSEKWIDDVKVVYIGKATSLRKRLGVYFRFGEGKNVAHYGGRYIWQLKNSKELIVCWKKTDEDPREIEAGLIQEFVRQHKNRPFANLID